MAPEQVAVSGMLPGEAAGPCFAACSGCRTKCTACGSCCLQVTQVWRRPGSL